MVRALLRLIRLPNVFTALADPMAGAALSGALQPHHIPLIAASGLFYAAGMALNDLFDRRRDARDRPERPIPSGQISPRSALMLSLLCLGAGLGLAAWVGGGSLGIAILLVLAIVAYDGGLKSTVFGPWSMGLCRGSSLVLGLSPALPQAWAAAILGGSMLVLYTASLTCLGRGEVRGLRARDFAPILAGPVVVLLLFVVAVAWGFFGGAAFWALLALLAAALLALFVPLWPAADGLAVRKAVGRGVRLIVLIDATMAAGTGNLALAGLILLLWGAATVASRWISGA